NSADIRIDYLGYPLSMGECKMLLLMTVIPLFFAKDKLIIKKWLLALISAPVFISMFLTQSRNVMLATAICLVITGIFINKRFLVLLIIVFTAGWLALPGSMQDRIKSIANPQHESNKSRLIMWNIGWQMFVDHPITGVGDNEITEIYKLYKKPEFHGEGSHLHSNIFMILATTGIFGFVSYLGMFIILFAKQIKYYLKAEYGNDKLLIFGSILAMISFHISGIFEWNFGDWKVMTILLFVLSLPFTIINIKTENNG
ncbi:O-antigen ligase domain-containing protein, partial [bacterium]